MKRFTAILLALCLLLTSCMALAEEGAAPPMGDPVWYYDDLSYTAYVDGVLSGDVTIPVNIDGNTIFGLRFNALCDQNEVTSLTTPETMYALQEGSVAYMEGLQSITLNDTLEVIGDSNFNNCPSLTSVTIPASVRLVGESFKSCPSLREIRFEGECPIFLGLDWAFYDLPEDYVIYVPDDQLDAYTEALADNYAGAAEHIQPSGKNAVAREQMDNEGWFMFDEATGAITGYSQYHAFVEIPASIRGMAVKSVAAKAMYGDSSIYGLVLPEGIERVESEAFESCDNLAYIKLPSTLKVIGDEAFYYTSLARIDWSEGLEEIGARAFRQYTGKTLTLPSTLKTIGEAAFEYSWISELHLSGALESIGSRAFAQSSIEYMAFDFYAPIEIADDAFIDSNGIADLDLPWDSSIENRDAYAEMLRDQCPNCTVWINNPINAGVAENPINDEAITQIENGVWTMYKGDQPNLTVWTDYDGILVTALGDGLFKGNQSIRSFYPDHCGWFTTIGDEAFADSSIEYVEPFGTITTIGSGAFRNCLNIKTLTLPASLTSIGEGALDGCDNLNELIVLCDPAILPDGLLDECAAHAEIYAAADATDEQVRILTEKANKPWYAPLSRLGETPNELIEMPYAMQSMDDYWYDTEYARLDRYHGYELNLYLPREAESVTLNTIGGDMMGRARAGDNYDMELPVRSVVIPENYTEIYSTSFAGCETLETVICYAPLEETAGMFEGCTNLREVIFVNGVRSLGYGVFYGCDKLETVYVGPYVEEVSDDAFAGCTNFDLSKCITDPALMPDIDALLAAVKSDPMPEPTPEPTPAPAMPIGEEGAPYFGEWQIETVEMEGETYSAADIGSDMTFILNADGTAEAYDEETTWTLENGVVMLDGMPMIANAEGKLVMEDEGMKWIFAKLGGAAEPAAEAVAEPAAATGDADAFIGKWQADILEMEGEVYPVALMGLDMYFILNADGTAEYYDGEVSESGAWTLKNGVVNFDGVLLAATEDGKLILEDEDSNLIFVKLGGEAAESEAPAIEAAPVVALTGDMDAYVGKWQADTLEMEGDVYPVGLMGLEMSFILNADGTAESYDGEVSESGTWAIEDGMVNIEGMLLAATDDGKLVMEDEEMKLVFVKTDAATESTEPATEPAVEPATDDTEVGTEEGFIGTWYGCYMVTGAIDGDPRSIFEINLTIREDGTANLAYPTDEAWHWMENEDGSLLLTKDSDGAEMPLYALDESFICFGKMDGDGNAFGGYIIFSRDAQAVWTPDMLSMAAAEPAIEADASAAVSSALGDRMEIRYVCKSAEANGVTLDASLLGGEYALTFHANGTVDFVMVGNTIPGLKWTEGDGSFIIDYYGNTMEAILTEKGFDLDYFGTMLMHFE